MVSILYDVAVVREGGAFDFDDADRREGWLQSGPSDEAPHALMTHDGVSLSWAGVVQGSASEWNEPLMNWWMALKPNTRYHLSFKTRESSSDASLPYVLVRSDEAFHQGENNVLFQSFDAGGPLAFVTHEYDFTTGDHPDYRVSFGERFQGAYFVDDVVVTEATTLMAEVDVRHTFIGDLVIRVGVGDPAAPLWEKVVFNRQGGSADDVVANFDVSEGSAYFPPQPGMPWYLRVEDKAGGDSGQIRRFAVRATSTNVPAYVSSERPLVPDLGAGTASILAAQVTAIVYHAAPAQLRAEVRCFGPNQVTWSKDITSTLRTGGDMTPPAGKVEARYQADVTDGLRVCAPAGSGYPPRFFLYVTDATAGGTGTIADFVVSVAGDAGHAGTVDVPITDFSTHTVAAQVD
jgi:hypothetical protein